MTNRQLIGCYMIIIFYYFVLLPVFGFKTLYHPDQAPEKKYAYLLNNTIWMNSDGTLPHYSVAVSVRISI